MSYAAFGRGPIGQDAYRAWLPSLSEVQRDFYDQEPDAAFEAWLRSLTGAAYNDEVSLRKLQSQLFANYKNQTIAGYPNTDGTDSTFVDFLGSLDPNKELARMPDQYKNQLSRQFTQPLRWVAFS